MIVQHFIILCTLLCSAQPDTWGFYSHRLINRMAVFTLPAELIGMYKTHIDYVADHAVDPDKRRYATRHEAVRHYIDIDHWGAFPFDNVPRTWHEALARHTTIFCTNAEGDTSAICSGATPEIRERFNNFFLIHILPHYYEDTWLLDCDSLHTYFPEVDCRECSEVFATEEFSEYGILPYHLVAMQHRLTKAFAARDLPAILRLSADFGHYIADAHVPLHTTENYNGQLTGQVGIHAFWETRIPELFAEEQYDFFVGKAIYIDDPGEYFWDIVLSSHKLVDEVLGIEKRLSVEYPSDRQFCFDERLEVTVRTQCAEYAQAYSEAMNGMVEKQMRKAVHAIGSAWYTAWVDAGQPEMDASSQHLSAEDQAVFNQLERNFRLSRIKGRAHPE